MLAIIGYDAQVILSLSEQSGLPVDEVRKVVDALAPDEEAIANRLQAVVIERFVQQRDAKRSRSTDSESRSSDVAA